MDAIKEFRTTLLVTNEESQLILEKILKEEGKKGSQVSQEIRPEVNIIGYLGEYFHLYLKYQRENEDQPTEKCLFVKSLPFRNPAMCNFIERSGILKKESQIYMRLLNEMRKLSPNIWCGQCYFAKPKLFVMENLVELGYEPIQDITKYLNKVEIQTILRGLASMHACSLGFEEKNKVKIGDLLKDVLYEVTVSPRVVWYIAGIKAVLAVIQKHRSYSAEHLQLFIMNKLPEVFNTVYDMVNPSSKYCNVFCHRDVWAGNVFFSNTNRNEKKAVFVDFQLSRYSPAAIDVLMALYLNIRPNGRKLIEEECYRFYYEQFSKQMADMGLSAEKFMTYKNFLQSLKEMTLFGALYNCIAATILKVPAGYLKDMKLNRPHDFYHYTNVDRTEAVLELMNTNAEFNSYMLECVEDMMQFILKSYYYSSSVDED